MSVLCLTLLSMISCKGCNQKAAGRVLVCQCCNDCWCASCAEKPGDTGILCCDHCDTVLCMSCGKGKGGTILVCSQCGDASCDPCLKKGKGKGMVCCKHCSKRTMYVLQRKGQRQWRRDSDMQPMRFHLVWPVLREGDGQGQGHVAL